MKVKEKKAADYDGENAQIAYLNGYNEGLKDASEFIGELADTNPKFVHLRRLILAIGSAKIEDKGESNDK